MCNESLLMLIAPSLIELDCKSCSWEFMVLYSNKGSQYTSAVCRDIPRQSMKCGKVFIVTFYGMLNWLDLYVVGCI